MLVTILPFFLAAELALDDIWNRNNETYYYGPECTFDVLVNMSLSNVVEKNDNFCSMIASELKCRPEGSDTLNCRFANAKIKRPDPEDARCTNAKDFVPVRTKFVNEDPFEIRFNSRGIENLVVSRTIPRWRLDMIKVIIDQLNIGFQLEKGHQRLMVTENSNIGQCEVEVRLSRSGYRHSNGDVNVPIEVPFNIVFEPERPDIVSLERARLQIEKTRIPKSCPNKRAYFFGNHEDFSMKNKSVYIDMTTSRSHIHISSHEFHSYSEVTGIMKTSDKSGIMNLYQRIDLQLKEIGSAQNALPEIRNPASTSPYAYSEVDRMRRSIEANTKIAQSASLVVPALS